MGRGARSAAVPCECLSVCDVGTVGMALGMQSQAIHDCQLSASESPVNTQLAKHARLGGPSGRYLFTIANTNDCSDVFKVQRTENNKYLASLTLYGHIKPQSSGPIYRNTVIGTLALMGGLLHSVQRGGA